MAEYTKLMIKELPDKDKNDLRTFSSRLEEDPWEGIEFRAMHIEGGQEETFTQFARPNDILLKEGKIYGGRVDRRKKDRNPIFKPDCELDSNLDEVIDTPFQDKHTVKELKNKVSSNNKSIVILSAMKNATTIAAAEIGAGNEVNWDTFKSNALRLIALHDELTKQ